MGEFDGYLICSDIDGTIEYSADPAVFERNAAAVKYFIENGGRFTFATGRYKFHVRDSKYRSLINAPASIFNGAVIYDFDTDKILFDTRLGITVREVFDFTRDYRENIVRINTVCDIDADMTHYIGLELPDEAMNTKPYKHVFVFDTPAHADEFRDFLEKSPEHEYFEIMMSWDIGVELVPKDGTKGRAIKRIKKLLPSVHTAIGIGDYENDIALIKDADIGVAVGSARADVKAAADLVVCDCKDCALCDLINRIENDRLK